MHIPAKQYAIGEAHLLLTINILEYSTQSAFKLLPACTSGQGSFGVV